MEIVGPIRGSHSFKLIFDLPRYPQLSKFKHSQLDITCPNLLASVTLTGAFYTEIRCIIQQNSALTLIRRQELFPVESLW